MRETIEVGDLVVIVKDCCGLHVGVIFEVDRIIPRHSEYFGTSGCCKKMFKNPSDYFAGRKEGEGILRRVPLAWLRRIPPLSELEGETERREVSA